MDTLKDVVAAYGAVIGTVSFIWNAVASHRGKRRNEVLESQASQRDLSVKHIRFMQKVHDIRRREKNLEALVPESDSEGRSRLQEIQKLFPNISVHFFSDKARVERATTTIDKVSLEPMHRRVDELLAHMEHMDAWLEQLQTQYEPHPAVSA